MMRGSARLLIVALACVLGAARAADAPREMHGVSDAFAAPGAALAWAVARSGASDATVVLRIDADARRYPFIAVIGIDPFTRATKTVLAPGATAASTDVRVPRAHFADFPRTEVRLYASAASKDAVAWNSCFEAEGTGTEPESVAANSSTVAGPSRSRL